MDELFSNLESNDGNVVEDAKKELTKAFSQSMYYHLFFGHLNSPEHYEFK